MELRLDEAEWEARTLREVYAACDPAGWDATGGLPRVVASVYPMELLDFLFYRRAVDAQAPAPFPGFRRPKKALTRSEARLVESAKKADRAAGVNPSERDPSEYEQDVFAFQTWRAKLPTTRNVRTGRLTTDTRAILLDAAGWVDTLAAYGDSELWWARMAGSRQQARLQIEEWAFNAMLVDLDWLRAIYRLSPQQAKIMRFYLNGQRREAIAVHLGVGVESVKEQLARSLKKIRDLWGLSPASAPLSMRRQSF